MDLLSLRPQSRAWSRSLPRGEDPLPPRFLHRQDSL